MISNLNLTETGLFHPFASKLLRSLCAIVLFSSLIATSASAPISPGAATGAKGLVLFTEPPSTFVEAAEYASLTRQSARYTVLVRSTGSRVEINTAGIVAVIPYPLEIGAEENETAAARLKAIQDAAQKYPQFKAKLDAVAAKWRTVSTTAGASAPRSSPVPSNVKVETGTSIVTNDGNRYEGVSDIKAEADVLSFTHSAGVATIDFLQLSPELRLRYNYDPERAEAARLAKKEAADSRKSATMQVAASGNLNGELRSGAKDLNSIVRAYRASVLAMTASKLEAGIAYRMQGLRIQQAGADFILLCNIDSTAIFGVLFFSNSKAIASLRMSRNDMIDGVARFVEFREVPLTNRTERLPIFESVGFSNLSTGGEFVNTEK